MLSPLQILLLALCAGSAHPDDGGLQKTARAVLDDVPPDPIAAVAESGPKWSGALNGGAGRQAGNERRQSVDLEARLTRRSSGDRYRGEAFWHHADRRNALGSRELSHRHFGGNLQYDYFFDRNDYALVRVGGEHNFKSSLDLRLSSGLGYGRQFVESEDLEISAEIGAGWFYEDYREQDPTDRLSGRLGYDSDWKPRERLALSHRGEVYPSLDDADDLHSRLFTEMRYDITARWFGLVQWRHEWDNIPATGRERSDQSLSLMLGYKL